MNKKEQRLRDEINYWSNHQELDKFNYNLATAKFLGNMTILVSITIGLSAILLSIQSNIIWILQIRNTLFLIILLIILFFTKKIKEKYEEEINSANMAFVKRDKMIEQKYDEIYGLDKIRFKEKLNKEFNNITL